MANIKFAQDAQEFNSWLHDESDEEVQEALNALPQEIKERLLQFGEDAESALEEISNAIETAIDAVNDAAGSVSEMESYVSSAGMELDSACMELEGL